VSRGLRLHGAAQASFSHLSSTGLLRPVRHYSIPLGRASHASLDFDERPTDIGSEGCWYLERRDQGPLYSRAPEQHTAPTPKPATTRRFARVVSACFPGIPIESLTTSSIFKPLPQSAAVAPESVHSEINGSSPSPVYSLSPFANLLLKNTAVCFTGELLSTLLEPCTYTIRH
jgi:hypothetical protein